MTKTTLNEQLAEKRAELYLEFSKLMCALVVIEDWFERGELVITKRILDAFIETTDRINHCRFLLGETDRIAKEAERKGRNE